MTAAISVSNLNKVYKNGFQALTDVNLTIEKGEIFALLGPNGAGKTTLISIICGLLNLTGGSVLVNGLDIIRDYRITRALVGLVPQELTTNTFESVWNTVSFSRGLFGKDPDPVLIEKILRDLSLWDKRDNRIMTLSGGMKRRVLIAKALAHEPAILFLDEPTAGVDVSLRKGMWRQIRELRNAGVTIILTTHYIAEAEEMADRIGIINHGRVILVDDKRALINKLGIKELVLELKQAPAALPSSLEELGVVLDRERLVYRYDSEEEENGIEELLARLRSEGLYFRDIHTTQTSLEDIFVKLVGQHEH